MANKSILDDDEEPVIENDLLTLVRSPRYFAPRVCPQCGNTIFGMSGGGATYCNLCGYNDPCCSD